MAQTCYVCKYTPTELLKALGGDPVLLDRAPENFELADQVAHPNLCGFGKGVIQTTLTMNDGSALKLTIMQYLSPDKHVIHEKGIKPTVKVKDKEDTEEDEQLEKAEDLLK